MQTSAPRLAFQKLMQAPRGDQFKIKGNVADVNNTINVVLRLPQESGIIKVQLKRRLQYKSSALSLNVRSHKILQAANWLATNSSLYREQGVSFSDDRVHRLSMNLPEYENTSQCCSQVNSLLSDVDNIGHDADIETEQNTDYWIQDDAEIPAGLTGTMLTAPDFLEDSEGEQIYSIAPEEGSTP